MTGSESDAPGLAPGLPGPSWYACSNQRHGSKRSFPMPSWLAALPRRCGPITASPTTMCCRISAIASTPYLKRSKQRTDG